MIFLVSGYSGLSSVFKLIGLIILCILIIAASYYTTRFVGKKQSGITADSNFKILDTMKISPNKYLQLVQIGKKYFCIAVCKDTVTFLTDVDETDIVLKNGESTTKSFKEILSSLGKHAETELSETDNSSAAEEDK